MINLSVCSNNIANFIFIWKAISVNFPRCRRPSWKIGGNLRGLRSRDGNNKSANYSSLFFTRIAKARIDGKPIHPLPRALPPPVNPIREAGQRSGHARSASGRSSLPAFPRINLPCTGQREGKKARGVSPRTDWPPMIRGTASHGRLPVPPVPPHHRRPSGPRHSFRREDVRYGWLAGRPITLFCAVADHNDTEQKLSMLPRIGFHACISGPLLPHALSASFRPSFSPLVLFLVEWVVDEATTRKDWGDCFSERRRRYSGNLASSFFSFFFLNVFSTIFNRNVSSRSFFLEVHKIVLNLFIWKFPLHRLLANGRFSINDSRPRKKGSRGDVSWSRVAIRN